MSTASSVNERLARITELGTSVWLDQIQRSLVASGELARMVEEESLRGVTSNPAIFEKAILGADDYDDQISEMTEAGADARGIYRAIAIQDVQEACDVLRKVYDATDGYDGYVSLEVDPDLAFDTEKTIAQAREYWEAVDRPNLMIKIPGTDEGLPAITDAIADGINVNVTLLFAVAQYAKVMEAYITGIERRKEAGQPLDVHSVASFFVSRVDSEVDKRLEKLDRSDLAGRAGLANARAAYVKYQEIFEGERFAALLAEGAVVQRALWASTGVKNPAYPDVLYVDGLVGPKTVNTMPMATVKAAAKSSDVDRVTVTDDPSEDLAALAEAGIDLDDVTAKLLSDGIDAFVTPMEKLLIGIESKREAITTHRPPTIEAVLPDELEPKIAARVEQAQADGVVGRIWRKDDTLWGEAGAPEVSDRLGWLTIADQLAEDVADLTEFAEQVRADGLTTIVLLGMGGSSLAPEVFRRSFGVDLHVLDTTDAEAVRAAPTEGALYVVSSKSGGTIETLSAFEHFWEATGGDGSRFVAITDPGTSLLKSAEDLGFRQVFVNDPNIGGRYSALSYFGLVPAALMGADVQALIDGAEVAAQVCQAQDRSNSGLWLGCALGELSLAGRDKLTFIIDPPVESFGLWVEQLVAESLGKHGKGTLPVADEPVGEPGVYGDDRVFAYLRNADDPQHDKAVGELSVAGHPVLTLRVDGAADLGRVMFFAEFATAVAGWVLELNPFDQPNVQSAKDKTKEVLDGDGSGVEPSHDEAIKELLGGSSPSYLAIQGYLAPSEAVDEAVGALRARIRDATKMTTTFGYGPRYLHSTGQLHKGGPPVGRFLQLVSEVDEDLPVPGQPFTFETLKRAQADGDLLALREAGFPVERVTIRGDAVAAIKRLEELL